MVIFGLLSLVSARPSYQDGYKVAVTQDTLGGYHFKYDAPDISREEHKNRDGEVRGSYSYLDPKNERQHIKFTAGRDGYVVVEGSNLPVAPLPVTETAVAAERIEHLSLLAGGHSGHYGPPATPAAGYGAPTTAAVQSSSYRVPMVPRVTPSSGYKAPEVSSSLTVPVLVNELALPLV